MQITLTDDVPGIGRAGQRVNLELKASDVHDPTEIPSYLAGYKPFGFRADEASKIILVDNDEDKYRAFDSDDAFLPVRVKQATTAGIPEVDPKSAISTYKVVDRFVGSFVPWHIENQTGNNYNPRMAAARRCARAILLDRELDVFGSAGLLAVTTNWDSAVRTALAGGYQWNGGANADPIADLQGGVEKSAQPVNGIWMNQKTAHAFIRNDKVRNHLRQLLGDAPAANIATSLANSANGQTVDFVIPGLPPIHVVPGKYKNASAAIVAILADGYVLLLTAPPGTPSDGEEIATTYTFRRRGPSGTGFDSREYHVDGRGPHGGTMVVVSMADTAVMTGSNCGGIITGAIQ